MSIHACMLASCTSPAIVRLQRKIDRTTDHGDHVDVMIDGEQFSFSWRYMYSSGSIIR